MIYQILLISNPFLDSYIHSDFLGKLIFIGLVLLSLISWVLIFYKTWQILTLTKKAHNFKEKLDKQKNHYLNADIEPTSNNPFKELYLTLKRLSLDLLNKNHHFLKNNNSFLSKGDIDFVEANLLTTVSKESKHLEKNLFILATIITLAPFLGLLGTVWGILTTFSEMQSGNAHQTVLNGLSLALATTVLGLIDAIPALIGYNYLKNSIRDFETDMISFSRDILAKIEMHYRKVDVD